MKRNLILLIICLLLPASRLFSQSFEDYVRNGGREIVANLAHPFNNFSYALAEVDDDGAKIYIKYDEGYETVIKFYYQNGIFNRAEVLRDTDWATPFLATAVMKDTAYSGLREVASDTVASIEGENSSFELLSRID